MTLTTPNYGNYGIFLIMGNAGFCPSTVGLRVWGLGFWGFGVWGDLPAFFAQGLYGISL